MTNSIDELKAGFQKLTRDHFIRLTGFSGDYAQWLRQIRTLNQDYYQALLADIGEREGEEAENLYILVDQQYSEVMSCIQAAEERMREATAHLKTALLAGRPGAVMMNVTPETFQ